MPARILIVDDHPAIHSSVRSLLECCDDFEVCGEAEDGARAVAKSAELQPDVVLLNISMPVMNGFDAARNIRIDATRLPPSPGKTPSSLLNAKRASELVM